MFSFSLLEINFGFQVMHFMPGHDRPGGGCGTKQKYTNPRRNHDEEQITSHDSNAMYSGHHRTFYDVVGVIGAESKSQQYHDGQRAHPVRYPSDQLHVHIGSTE